MHSMRIERMIRIVVLAIAVGLALASITAARAGNDHRGPQLPSSLCDTLQIPAGNKVAFHVYARGVQIYRWSNEAWVFVAPMATLFSDAGFHGQVGVHYAGPTWETNSGSKVVAGSAIRCSPDADAIPWLRLQTVSTTGPGILSPVTYVHRVNTVGGLAPVTPGSLEGESIEIPYTAEYYFYRAED